MRTWIDVIKQPGDIWSEAGAGLILVCCVQPGSVRDLLNTDGSSPGWTGVLTCAEIPSNGLIWARRGKDTFLISSRALRGGAPCRTHSADISPDDWEAVDIFCRLFYLLQGVGSKPVKRSSVRLAHHHGLLPPFFRWMRRSFERSTFEWQTWGECSRSLGFIPQIRLIVADM